MGISSQAGPSPAAPAATERSYQVQALTSAHLMPLLCIPLWEKCSCTESLQSLSPVDVFLFPQLQCGPHQIRIRELGSSKQGLGVFPLAVAACEWLATSADEIKGKVR